MKNKIPNLKCSMFVDLFKNTIQFSIQKYSYSSCIICEIGDSFLESYIQNFKLREN